MTETMTEADREQQLLARIAEYEQQVADATKDLGVAELDGSSTAAATERLEDARRGIARANAALAELDRRATVDAISEKQLRDAQRRVKTYEEALNYFELAEKACRLHDEAQAARARVVPPFGKPPRDLNLDPVVGYADRKPRRIRGDDFRVFDAGGLGASFFADCVKKTKTALADARTELAELEARDT
jgi:hypothetical protein